MIAVSLPWILHTTPTDRFPSRNYDLGTRLDADEARDGQAELFLLHDIDLITPVYCLYYYYILEYEGTI